jgi:cystinosin
MAVMISREFTEAISRLLGWVYFICWGVSFYPQALLNWRRRSTAGLTIDFPALNVLGFSCYSISTAAFLYSPVLRHQYAIRHPVSPEPTQRFNDLAFAVHAAILSIITLSQFWWRGFTRDRSSRLKPIPAGILLGSCLAVWITAAIVISKGRNGGQGKDDPRSWAWIDVIYAIGYVKLVVTVVKYIPQAWANFKRKSTAGWSISQILLDLSGGILSLLQLILDSSLQNDWSGVTGNPVKFGLSFISLLFDAIFIVQHYWLYPDRQGAQPLKTNQTDDEGRPLLETDGSDQAAIA